MMITNIHIENLKCGGCAATIKKGILAIENTTAVTIDVEKSIVSVTSDKDNIEAVKQKLTKLGYPETGDRNTIVHKAKSFVSCAVGRLDS